MSAPVPVIRKPPPPAEVIAKLPPDGGPDYNRLVHEKSPYLLQHAANPVDWFPWGEEAFAKAKAEDKPVFLSIGYATCHWCHVMEHESFEDGEIGRLMNDAFVCIKVDREERPDIDSVYMSVTMALTGSGGWPMTVILTPEKKPFFAGTYFPKEGRYGRPGLRDLIAGISDAWRNRRQELMTNADQITRLVSEGPERAKGGRTGADSLTRGFREFAKRYDSRRGGFGRAPKFPSPHNLGFLMRYWKRTGEPQALDMTVKTLREMRLGGVYDHVGFGFHRYSTDAEWLVPHFEKMLYDQAMLVVAYAEAFQVTGDPEHARTVREIITYILRDMTSPEGGFYSAEDADSEGVEGRFYVWTPAQVRSVLGEAEGTLFCSIFNIVEGGNFTDEATGRTPGDSIPHLKRPLAELASELHLAPEELDKRIESAREKLFAEREKRVHPLKDDKILTDWNGLMIAALARAGVVLREERFTQAARRAVDFILNRLRGPDGRLLHRFRNGSAGLPATNEDYAFMIWGLIELYQAELDPRWLAEALKLIREQVDYFWDAEHGGFFLTANDAEKLIARPKEIYDGAIPSGNSVSALNLVRLARLSGDSSMEDRAARILDVFASDVSQMASGHAFLLQAVDFMTAPGAEVVIVGRRGGEDVNAMLSALRGVFLPSMVVLFRPWDEADPDIAHVAPFTAAMKAGEEGASRAYVCRNQTCSAPVDSVEAMMRLLEASSQ